jgi:hypothetical protein
MVITRHERDGSFRMISDADESSDTYFISDTSILNLASGEPRRITWPTTGFLRFASTLSSKYRQRGYMESDRACCLVLCPHGVRRVWI